MNSAGDAFEGFVANVVDEKAGVGGADVTYDLRPPSGEMWEVLFCVIFHDDDHVNRAVGYRHYNSVGTQVMDLYIGAAEGVNTFRSLYDVAKCGGTIVCTNQNYLQAICYSVTDTHKVKIRAIVRKLRGLGLISGS